MTVSSLSPKKRKRGVRACRGKLEKSMANAGFKTQASLAEAIADKENIETVPKDFVSKVFREIPVAPASIERIANIIGVESYTLYMSKEDNLLDPQSLTITAEKKPEIVTQSKFSKSTNNKLALALIVICILIVILSIGSKFSLSDAPLTNIENKTQLHQS